MAAKEPVIVAIHDAIELPAKLAEMNVTPKNLGKFQQELLAALAQQMLPGTMQATYQKALKGDVRAQALIFEVFAYTKSGPSTVINNLNQMQANNGPGAGAQIYNHDAMVRAAGRAQEAIEAPAEFIDATPETVKETVEA